jgi:hypothetical protein
MNERTLSSAQTFWMKFVFPTRWISMFGLGTFALFLGVFRGTHDSAPPDRMKWGFLAAWIAGTIFIYSGCAGLKRVRIKDSAIYVSNYLKEIRIPFDNVADVTENRWINIHPVTIHLRSATEFGERITFMPKIRIFSWRSHPVVAELRELAHAKISDLASARERFRRSPIGMWASYLGAGHDNNIGMIVTFFEDGSGAMEEWGFDQMYDPAYVSEPKFHWRNLGERKIEITHRGQVRVVEYDFKIARDQYGLEELRMFEPTAKPDAYGDLGFWLSPFSLVYREPDRAGIIERLKKALGAAQLEL